MSRTRCVETVKEIFKKYRGKPTKDFRVIGKRIVR